MDLETKIHVYLMSVTGRKLPPTGGTRTFAKLSQRVHISYQMFPPGNFVYLILQVCICFCGVCLKEDILVRHPAFLGLH